MIDVIEHMTKSEGEAVLVECNRVARQQIVLFTPLGYMPQEVHAGDLDGWNLSGGDRQEHKSGWLPEDFPDWDILACKHLHEIDHKGEPIDPAYGGFFAVKNKTKPENHFNPLYSKSVLQNSYKNLDIVEQLIPNFVDHVVLSALERNRLKCAIQSSSDIATHSSLDVPQTKPPNDLPY